MASLAVSSDALAAAPRVVVQPPWRDDVAAALRALPWPPGTAVTTALAPRHGEPWPATILVVVDDVAVPRAWAARAARLGVTPARAGAVAVWAIPADAPVAGGGLDVARATVRVLAAGAPVSCPWDAAQRRHSCRGLPSWMYVAEEALVVDGRRERCVWAHPRTGAALTIDFDDVSAPHGLRLQAALSDQAAQTPGGAPVTYVLTRADARAGAPMAQELARVTVHARRGFTDGVTGPLERGQLRLTVTTTNDRQRHTCFRLTPLAAPGVSQAAP